MNTCLHSTPSILVPITIGSSLTKACRECDPPVAVHRKPYVGRRGDPKKEKRGGDPKGEVEEKSSGKTRADRLRKRRGESQSFLLGDADQESETRMSKNALRTGRRQAVE
ncbi:hypothetical protein TNCV_1861551 [Trichonephila clavipes]|nr:hypothetical protein TNCV_1861551 [Trichonephila clavipes]